MSPSPHPAHSSFIIESALDSMPPPMKRVVTTAPVITEIVRQAKEIAAEHPDFVRGDQGQIVGVYPDKEVYYGPSSGLLELRQVVGRFWTLAYHLEGIDGIPDGGLRAEHVAIVQGATEGLAILMRVFAPGRTVGLPALFWGNYRNLISLAGGRWTRLDYFRPDGSLNLDGLAQSIDEYDIEILILNFPSNPTGDILTDDELSELARLARERKLILISDEVYNWIRYDDNPRSMLAYAPERTLVVGAASREYLIPGARTGYVICPDNSFSDIWMPRLIRATSSSPNVLGQRLTLELIGSDVSDLEAGEMPRYLSSIKAELKRRRDRMVEVLLDAGFTLETRRRVVPQGGICLLARLPGGLDDIAFIEKAMTLAKFSAIPGSAFGAPGCIRFGYAGIPVEDIERMGRSLHEVLNQLSE